jgi:hypothetical protein
MKIGLMVNIMHLAHHLKKYLRDVLNAQLLALEIAVETVKADAGKLIVKAHAHYLANHLAPLIVHNRAAKHVQLIALMNALTGANNYVQVHVLVFVKDVQDAQVVALTIA